MKRVFDSQIAALGLLLALSALGATCAPPPDVDGQPGGAQILSTGRVHADRLHCRAGDCVDWYRVESIGVGDLTVRATTPAGVLSGDRTLVLVLASSEGRQLYKAIAGGPNTEAVIEWRSSPGSYMVRVEARDSERTELPYELALDLEAAHAAPPPPPPVAPIELPPAFVQGEVLEVEGGLGNPDAVLIDQGKRAGIREGQTGRLLNGSETIAEIRIVDTYPDGSRAVLSSSLRAPISPTTRAEIDVPGTDGP